MFEMDSFAFGKANRPSKLSTCGTYLIELNQSSCASKCHRQTIGLLHGNYHNLPHLPDSVTKALGLSTAHLGPDLLMTPFISSSDEDELAEFRILNFKDRVIVRSLDDDKHIIFGSQPAGNSRQYLGYDVNSTLVVRGPVSICHRIHEDQGDKDDAEDEEEEEEEGKDGAEEKEPSNNFAGNGALGGDTCKTQAVKYSGHVTLNISGFAFIDCTEWRQGVTIVLPSESKFSVERTIPHRFQQKTIVQRQKEKFQSTQGLLSLETFSHLRF